MESINRFIDHTKSDLEYNSSYTRFPSAGNKTIAIFKEPYDDSAKIIEGEIAWKDSTTEWLMQYIHADPATDRDLYLSGDRMETPSLDVLYALKMSHRFLKDSPAFLKTMRDIKTMRKMLGHSEILPELQEWYERRSKETYDYGHPNLHQTKGAFFNDDGIDYIWDHDTIHLTVARMDKPAYQFFKPEENDVMVSKDMWDKCDDEIRLNAVIEESCVLALERSQIPFGFVHDPMKSYTMALEKVCTSITSGWFRDWAWEHYDEALEGVNQNYVDLFHEGVKDGYVKPYVPCV